jgi:hypothetical protein
VIVAGVGVGAGAGVGVGAGAGVGAGVGVGVGVGEHGATLPNSSERHGHPGGTARSGSTPASAVCVH